MQSETQLSVCHSYISTLFCLCFAYRLVVTVLVPICAHFVLCAGGYTVVGSVCARVNNEETHYLLLVCVCVFVKSYLTSGASVRPEILSRTQRATEVKNFVVYFRFVAEIQYCCVESHMYGLSFSCGMHIIVRSSEFNPSKVCGMNS